MEHTEEGTAMTAETKVDGVKSIVKDLRYFLVVHIAWVAVWILATLYALCRWLGIGIAKVLKWTTCASQSLLGWVEKSRGWA